MIDPGGSTGEGSWSELVGPGKAVDTNSFFVICPNMLGSSYGSTNAASVDPATYFLLDSEYGHSASGRDAHKWAPRLRQFIERLNQ
jgi:homoserine acetyltransferase